MGSLGTKLRETRESRGLTLEEIAVKTKIRQCYLEAIEKDELHSIPGGFFTRSFARQYAAALGVDAGNIESMLNSTAPLPGEEVQLSRLSDYRSPNTSTVLPAGNEAESGTEFYHEAAFLKERKSGGVWMVLAILMICASTGYLAWSKRPEAFDKIFAKEPEKPSKPAAPAAAAENILAEQLPLLRPAPVPEADPSAPVTVEVKAVEPTWLRLIADGRRTFGGTLEAGETRTLTGDESAVVFTGNAGGLELVYNGRALGAPGPRGMIRTVVFTPENFEIRSSAPVKKPSSSGARSAGRGR